MQIVRFRADGKTRYGALEGSAIIEYSGTPFTRRSRPCATDLDPGSLSVERYPNGVARHRSSTKEMVFSVEEIVARVSTVMTLLAGDVIATGTPAGAGRMEPGDGIEVLIDGIGSLRNTVVRL